MNQYRLEKKKGDGTFSEVFMAKQLSSQQHVAIKCMKSKFNSLQQVMNNQQIDALKRLSPHPHIVQLIKVLYDEPSKKLALVFELMDMNLYECLKNRKVELTMKKIKFYMWQLLKSIAYIHSKGVFHRDIKPENILLLGDVLKLADFGSCKGISKSNPHTSYIATRWYRPPECLMTDGYYNHKMDIWGFGCVLFEMVTKYPLFPGKNELDQVHRIHSILGTPSQELLARYKLLATHMDIDFPKKKGIGFQKLLHQSQYSLIDLLKKVLAYDPADRISASQALQHEFFSQIHEITQEAHFKASFMTSTLSLPKSYSPSRNPIKKNLNKENKKETKLFNEQQLFLPPIRQLKVNLKLNVYASNNTTLRDMKNKATLKKKYEDRYAQKLEPVLGRKIQMV